MFKKILISALALLMLVPMFASVVHAEDEIISVGKSYTLEYAIPIHNAYPNKEYKSETKLTDGITATTDSYNDEAWLELYRGAEVTVTIDLEEVMAISKVSVGQFQHRAAGIVCSRYVKVYVSEDGENFNYAGEVQDPRLATYTVAKRVGLTVELDNSYKARYVRVVFSSSVNTNVDEIMVYGNSDVSSAVEGEPYTEPADKGVAGDIDGIKSICLMYVADMLNQNQSAYVGYTAQTLKYYFAYIDGNGNAKDQMFDSLLFLGIPQDVSQMNKAQMEVSVKNTFHPNYNVGALNTVVGDLKDDLGLDSDYKYPIFLSVPNFKYSTAVFGEIDGKNIQLNSLEKRAAAVKWYIDYIEAEFEKCNFENLEIKGLYWFAESINYAESTHEAQLVKYFNEYSHEKGYKTMWIPYYSASGVDVSKGLGFDSVTMQSGYAFDNASSEVGAPKAEVCADAAEVVKKYGLNGMEFEVDMNSKDYARKFAKYVSASYGAGLMENGMMTMYQVGDHLFRSAVGTNAVRTVYELTYKYCSGTYYEATPVIKEGKTVTVALNSYYNDKLEIIDEDTKKSDLKIATIEKPDGIFFAAEGNGFFEVQTYDCQPGTYTARVSVTDGTSISNTVEITIIVEPDAVEEPAENGGMDLWVIIVIIVGALAVIAAVAVVVIKSNKKK